LYANQPMNDWRSEPARRHDDVTLPAIRVAFVLSLLVHGAALWTFLPHMRVLAPSPSAERGETGSPLAVKLAPLQSPPGSMPSTPEPVLAQSAPAHGAPPPRAIARAPSAPPMMTVPRRAPDVPQRPRAVPEAAPAPPTPASEPDLASYVEARRRARGESAPTAQTTNTPPTEDENERRNRIIAANIGMNARPSFGTDPKNGGGLFQMKSMDFAEAEFYFFGWNKDISRNSKQLIEVRRGENSDIRIAVIRRMIAIVREHETGDFLWESPRLGRQLTLSARQKDNAELEAFLMQEFFSDPRRRN
jgi:hypothetical protein